MNQNNDVVVVSDIVLIKSIDSVIKHLEKIKSEIMLCNASKFTLKTEMMRPVKILCGGFFPIGFQQTGPKTFHLTIEDYRNVGQPL